MRASNLKVDQIVIKDGVKIVLTTDRVSMDLIAGISPLQGKCVDVAFVMPQTEMDYEEKEQLELPAGSGVFAVFEWNPEDEQEIILDERYDTREAAEEVSCQLSADNRENRYRVDELTDEQAESEGCKLIEKWAIQKPDETLPFTFDSYEDAEAAKQDMEKQFPHEDYSIRQLRGKEYAEILAQDAD